MACNIKTLSEVLNTGIDAFSNSFGVTGDTTKALRYALKEMKVKHPDADFDIKTFTDYITEPMKQAGLLESKYEFGHKKTSTEKEAEKLKKTIDKTVARFDNLGEKQKADLARKIYDKVDEQGLLRDGDVQDLYAGMLNMPSLSDIQKGNYIQEASNAMKEHKEAEQALTDVFDAIAETKQANGDNKLTIEQEKELSAKLFTASQNAKAKMNAAQKAKQALSQKMTDKRYWELTLIDMAQMNLLSPVTLAANLTGMGADALLRLPKNIISGAIDLGINSVQAGKLDMRTTGSKVSGLANSLSDATEKSKQALLYNNMGLSKGLPQYDHMNAVSAWKKIFMSHGSDKIINSMAFAFRLSPDFIKRGLAAPDAFVHELIFGSELNKIADKLGLTGIDKQMFITRPEEKYSNQAKDVADEATLRSETGISKALAFNPYQAHDNFKKSHPTVPEYMIRPLVFLRYFGTKFIAPFVKTPINLIKLSARYVIPGLEATIMYGDYKKATDPIEKQRIISEGVGRMAVGFWVQQATMAVILAGGVSAGFKDDDDKVQDALYKKLGGVNRLNYHAFLRALMGGSAEWEEGDDSIELRSLGVLGLVVGAHAHAFNKYSKKENEDHKFSVDPGVVLREGKAVFTSALDNTFLSGSNQAIDVFVSDEDDKMKKLTINAMSFLLTGMDPASVQKISVSQEKNTKQSYNKEQSMGENVANTLGYKFLFNAIDRNKEMKDKVSGLASEEKDVVKTKDHYLFDNALGRVLHAEISVFKSKEIENTPVSKLLDASKEQPKEERSKMFPSGVGVDQKLGKGRRAVTVHLTPEQHTFLMKQASMMRMIAATPYINSDKFKKDSYEVKAASLDIYYKTGLDLAKQSLAKKYSGQFTRVDKTDDDIKKEAKDNARTYSTKNSDY